MRLKIGFSIEVCKAAYPNDKDWFVYLNVNYGNVYTAIVPAKNWWEAFGILVNNSSRVLFRRIVRTVQKKFLKK